MSHILAMADQVNVIGQVQSIDQSLQARTLRPVPDDHQVRVDPMLRTGDRQGLDKEGETLLRSEPSHGPDHESGVGDAQFLS